MCFVKRDHETTYLFIIIMITIYHYYDIITFCSRSNSYSANKLMMFIHYERVSCMILGFNYRGVFFWIKRLGKRHTMAKAKYLETKL